MGIRADAAAAPMPLPAGTTTHRRWTPKQRRTRLLVKTVVMWAVAAACFLVGWVAFGASGTGPNGAPVRSQSFLLQSLGMDELMGPLVADLSPLRRNDTDEEPECQHIESHYPNMCEFVKEYCEDDGILAYLNFRYCKWGGQDTTSRFTLHAPILILWFFLIIAVLASTAEQFFVPALEHLSEELKLSPDISGITLVAFGNGGPDIVSAIAAVRSDDFSLALGGLVGAAIFICTLCVGIIYTLTGSRLLVAKETFLRDLVAMIVCVSVLVAMTSDERIWIYEALGILAVYVVYVGVVVWWSKRNQRAADMNRVASASMHNAVHHRGKDHAHLYSDADEGFGVRGYSVGADVRLAANDGTSVGDSRRSKLGVEDLDHPLLVQSRGDSIQSQDSMLEEPEEPEDPYRMFGLSPPTGKDSLVSKILYVLEFPFNLLRWLTIPSHEFWDTKRKWFTVLSMPGLALLGLFCAVEVDGFGDTMGDSGIPIWTVVLLAGAVLGALIWFWTPNGMDTDNDDPELFVIPEPSMEIGLNTAQRRVLMVLAFLGSVAWLYLVADEAVAVLQTLGIMWDLGTAILGLTVLAIGNSIGDLAANLAVARGNSTEGPATAVASCFGSPLLNFMLGLGVALLVACLDDYPEPFRFKADVQVNLAWVFLGIVLVLNLVLLHVNNYRPKPYIGIVLAVVYAIFLVMSILVEVDVLKF